MTCSQWASIAKAVQEQTLLKPNCGAGPLGFMKTTWCFSNQCNATEAWSIAGTVSEMSPSCKSTLCKTSPVSKGRCACQWLLQVGSERKPLTRKRQQQRVVTQRTFYDHDLDPKRLHILQRPRPSPSNACTTDAACA